MEPADGDSMLLPVLRQYPLQIHWLYDYTPSELIHLVHEVVHKVLNDQLVRNLGQHPVHRLRASLVLLRVLLHSLDCLANRLDELVDDREVLGHQGHMNTVGGRLLLHLESNLVKAIGDFEDVHSCRGEGDNRHVWLSHQLEILVTLDESHHLPHHIQEVLGCFLKAFDT